MLESINFRYAMEGHSITKEVSMVSSVSSTSSYLLQMLLQTTQQRQDDLFTKVDTSGDSKVDKTEFSALAKKLSEDTGTTIDTDDIFTTYDVDGDGSLSEDELKSFMKDNAPMPNDMNGAMGQMSSQAMQQNLDDLFSKIDSDGDSAISESEFSTFANNTTSGSGSTSSVEDLFSTYDTDGDGSLSEEELNAFMKDNPPPPPPQMQSAMSAYGANSDTEELSDIFAFLKTQSSVASSLSITV